jgi:16S rRNA (uracil1498-N3)-methyltransferase
MPRFHCPLPLTEGAEIDLPEGCARHVQVLRLQPGADITLFDGGGPLLRGGEWTATVLHMGRTSVRVRVGAHQAIEREGARAIHLLAGTTAGERMDWLVEKATELGMASLTPLATERSMVRLHGERAAKKQAHWQAVAVAACEQCGRNRVPHIHPLASLAQALAPASAAAVATGVAPLRLVLSLAPGSVPLRSVLAQAAPEAALQFLSGPEGGLSAQEEQQALAQGFVPVSLGPRVLRAETAPLAALAALL